ncbi:39S mitochondrial ribosomal protein L46 domain-containing protein [Trichoderma ceciliae]
MMAASSRGSRAVRGIFSSSPTLCTRCATTFSAASTRFYSAATVTEVKESVSGTPLHPPISSTTTPYPYDIRSGLILTRPPLLTRPLHPFENAFFFYQKRLEERLNTPFITSIYFKPDTAAQLDWSLKVQERGGTVAKELGTYHGKNSKAWDDELKIGDPLSAQYNVLNSLLKDAAARVSDDAEIIAPEDVVPVERPMERLSEADKKNDVRRLNRQMEKTLYLVVKGADGWGFPTDILKDENLHEGAKRVLDQAAGVNMNTWLVGRVPVAHLVQEPVLDANGEVQKKGQKTFFLKGRIMAGQADLKGNPFGYTDFKWLTREELEKELAPEYFRGVRNMMADR